MVLLRCTEVRGHPGIVQTTAACAFARDTSRKIRGATGDRQKAGGPISITEDPAALGL